MVNLIRNSKAAEHSVHPTGGSLRVFKQFVWLEADSVKMTLSRPTHQRVTQAVGRSPSDNYIQGYIMDINLLIGIVGLILSIVGIVDAIYVRKKSNQKKNLVYEVIPPVSIAELSKSKGNYSLRVVYEPSDSGPVYIENEYMQLVRFANFGATPITKNDLATTDKLRIEIKNGNVLDVSLSSTTRNVCQIILEKPIKDNNTVIVNINFEFLDYLDGGLIQILCDTENLETNFYGTVVGMSEGIQRTLVHSEPIEVPDWGCATGVIFELGALVAVVFFYKYVIGGWDNVWILSLPIIALIAPFLLFSLLMFRFPSSRDKFQFPKQLLPPSWYRLGGGGWHYSPDRQKEMLKLKTEIESLKAQLRDKRHGNE
jgi:hypothetical protein